MERWQEVAWRANAGFHLEEAPVGDRIIKFIAALAEMQHCSGADGSIPTGRRVTEMAGIVPPALSAQIRRVLAKRTSGMRKLWRLLRLWLKIGKISLNISDLSKYDRWYVHQWCN